MNFINDLTNRMGIVRRFAAVLLAAQMVVADADGFDADVHRRENEPAQRAALELSPT